MITKVVRVFFSLPPPTTETLTNASEFFVYFSFFFLSLSHFYQQQKCQQYIRNLCVRRLLLRTSLRGDLRCVGMGARDGVGGLGRRGRLPHVQ